MASSAKNARFAPRVTVAGKPSRKAVNCKAAAATAWDSWSDYMNKRTAVRKPVAEELKLFGEIGSKISSSATTFTPKFAAGGTVDGSYKQLHVDHVASSIPLSDDLHEKLETMAMLEIKDVLGLPDGTPLDVATTSATTSDVNAGVCVTGLMQQSGSYKKAVVCFIVTETERQASWSRLEGLLLHWACSASPGSGWHMPPAGWSSLMPGKSADAGGAVQCAFERKSMPNSQQTAYVLVMELPLSGILRSGGVSFVLKASEAQNTKWLKDAGSDSDFFVDLHSMPFCKL